MQGTSINTQGTRLVTHSMLFSAALAQTRVLVTEEGIADLCQLIDIYCLCDRAIYLGKAVEPDAFYSTSPLLEILVESDFVAPFDIQTDLAITSAASRHLMAYLGESEGAQYSESLLDALHASCTYPAFSEDLRETLGEIYYNIYERVRHERDANRQEFFEMGGDKNRLLARIAASGLQNLSFVRSFLYLGVSDVSGFVFVPDSARVPFMSGLVESEHGLRSRLLGAMKSGWDSRLSSRARRITPLAAVVFERAKPDPRRIPREMLAMREELEPLRVRLRSAELVLEEGKGDAVPKALNEWNLIVQEIEKSFGLEPSLVSTEKILGLGSGLGEVQDEPTSAKSWIGFLLGLPFEVVRRVIARGPAVELHHIRKELPASGRLRSAAQELFGITTLT